ncbi:MAG: PAS domain-containing protein [Patescibacteria group bacterium]
MSQPKATILNKSRITIDHTELIRSLAVPFLVYEAMPPYRILDQNAAHEKVAMTKRKDIIGRPFLEAFPDTSGAFKRTGKSAPIESIKRIVRTKQSDDLGEFKWDVVSKDGSLKRKYWKSTQYPVFDDKEEVIAVYQLTEDITQRKLADKQLALTKYQLDQTLADGLIGTWLWDMRGAKVYAGPSLAGMFGVSDEAAAKGLELDNFVASIHPEDRKRVSSEIQNAVKTRSTFEAEYRTIDREGRVRWLIARGRVEADDAGELDRFPGVVVDITARKETERAMEESEERLRFMADSMPQLVWISGPNGNGEYFNQRWYDFTGAAADGNSISWSDYIHPEDRKRATNAWAKSVKKKTLYELEYRLFHAPSKMHRWVIVRAAPLKTADGSVVNWYGTCTDIDEQRRAADIQMFLAKASKELAASLNYQKTLKKVASLCVPTIADWCSVELVRDDGTFEQVSVAHRDPEKLHQAAEYRKLNPVDMSQPTGLPNVVRTGEPEFYPHISDEMLEQYIEDKEKLAYMKSLNLRSIIIAPIKINGEYKGGVTFVSSESGRYYSDADLTMANDLASRISLAMTNASLYTESTQSLKIRKMLESNLLQEKQRLERRVEERTKQLRLTNQGLLEEINKRQSAEKELSEYSDELTRSNKELEDFAYVASHDLQEPLRKIQAFGNLLLGEYGDSLGIDGADYLKRMHSAANRMSVLIEDLLAFSRVTRTQHRGQLVDLSDTLVDVISDLESRIDDTKAEIRVGKLPTVVADPTHMRQLFQNLVGNAVKFHRPGVPPLVSIKSSAKRGGCEITVSDNGIGFDEKYLDRIFAVFQRLHERSNYEGTGIGLAVCRKIVERYDGTITAASTKGKGSTFIIWLPIKKEKK